MTLRWIGALAVALLFVMLALGGAKKETMPDPLPDAKKEALPEVTKTAIFAGGCFWCMEAAFDKVCGVVETTSGYAGGTKPNPTYGSHKGYQEAVRVVYDPTKVTYAELLEHYWHNIDPFARGGQFCDEGNAYRSVVFFADYEEKSLAENTRKEIAARFKKKVRTRIRPATTFTPAEDYHQDYHTKNPASFAFYERGCGRAKRLKKIWGDKSF